MANSADISTIRAIAEESWDATYSDLLSREQLDYMLDWMYSEAELKRHMRDSHWIYFLIKGDSDAIVGFAGMELDYQVLTTKLHRIYLLPHQQGKGLGKLLINKVKETTAKYENSRLVLTVNKKNPSLQFYQSQGFQIIDSVTTNIGEGYVMDDYVLEILL